MRKEEYPFGGFYRKVGRLYYDYTHHELEWWSPSKRKFYTFPVKFGKSHK